MSREIKTINPVALKLSSDKVDPLRLTSFYGGAQRGRSLQLTIGNRFTQLTEAEVRDLIMDLLDWKNRI